MEFCLEKVLPANYHTSITEVGTMKKLTSFTILLTLVFAIGVVFAQMPDLAGKKELGLSGSFNVGSDNAMINTQVFMGYFINNVLQIGPTFGGTFNYSDDADDSYNANAGAFIRYHFPTESKAVPFIGGSGGGYFTKFGDTTDTIGMASGTGGVKFFISENTSFFIQYDYQRVFAEAGSISFSYGTFGFSTFF